MNLLQWLLDLENIQLGRDAPLVFEWHAPWRIEAWMLVCFALLAVTWISLVYRREQVSVVRRVLLAGTRCAIVTLAVAVLCRPSLVLQRDRVEPSFVAVALDTSMSMAERDKYVNRELAKTICGGTGVESVESLSNYTRFELASQALTRDDGAAMRTLLERNAVQLCTFSDRLHLRGYFARDSVGTDLIDAIRATRPAGTATDIAGAVRDIIEQAKGRRLAAIVLVSDGQSTQAGHLNEALDDAKSRQVPIYTVRIGSPVRPMDIELRTVLAQDSVFVNDLVAVEARISSRGLTEAVPLDVRLVDERSGETVDTRQVILDEEHGSAVVELRAKPTKPGLVSYRVEVPVQPAEVIAENNMERVEVNVLDNQLRVLYCEGYPRYEYRYLKNALLREKTIKLSVLLIEADERFVQEGTDPIRGFPESPEELNRYDVVLFGDVDPRGGWLSIAQMRMLLDFVGNAGGGFALIAGERSAPHRFLSTPLEKLIPVRIDPSFLGRYDTPLTTGFRAQLTADGLRSRIFRTAADRTDGDADKGVFQPHEEMYWFARTLGPRPGASVLCEHPLIQSEAGLMPIVVTARYGAGKIFFQATDDTWRWRRGTGEFAHDTYWVQVTRSLMRGSRLSQARRLSIRTDHSTYAYGKPVRTHVRVFDSELLSNQSQTMVVVARETNDGAGSSGGVRRAGSQSPFLEPEESAERFKLHRLGSGADQFEGTWIPPHPGKYTLELSDFTAHPDETVPSVSLHVERPNLELRHPEANHEMLERLADATGGKIVNLDELSAALAEIPDRSVRIPDDVVEPLWDSKLVFVLFALMISIEWVSRKAMGLL